MTLRDSRANGTVIVACALGAVLVTPKGAALAAAPPTPNCPGITVDAPCIVGEIRGNTYVDQNRNGRYDPAAGDTRASGLVVRLLDPVTGAVLEEVVSNATGYYSFPEVALTARYQVEVELPAGYRATTPTRVEVEERDFSTYWCCTARVDFGVVPGHSPTPSLTSTATASATATPADLTPLPPPPTPPPSPTATIPPCVVIPPGRQIHLPVLNHVGTDGVCASIVEVQNVGAWPTKAILLVWGHPSACPPQCAGPLKVECSGLLSPGAAWHFVGSQLPVGARSGMVFSAAPWDLPLGGGASDVFADRLCEALMHEVVGNCDAYRRFKKAFNELRPWLARETVFDFGTYVGASLSVEVVRKCPGDANPLVFATSSYVGLADQMLGVMDLRFGDYSYFAPLVTAGFDHMNSVLYVQNGGLECAQAEIWFQEQGDCLRRKICEVMTLAPGETQTYDATSCVAPGWIGSAWIRGSQPLSVVVDAIGQDQLATYQALPSDVPPNGPVVTDPGPHSRVLYGPLVYSEHQGWQTHVQVQNLSRTTNAKVKLYFLDRSGNVVTTLSEWLCPGGSQGVQLPRLAGLPGNWIGSLRVESQDWSVRGAPPVAAPDIAAVALLKKHADVAATVPLETVAYGLVPESWAFDWQTGHGSGGLASGVGQLAIPSLIKDRNGLGLTTELAVANVVPAPGFTDFALLIYDQNGLVDIVCEKLGQLAVEYIDLGSGLATLSPGFRGSAVISAVSWYHPILGPDGQLLRNLLGLAAVKLERSGTIFGLDAPGDESAASEALPILGPPPFVAPPVRCPGSSQPGMPTTVWPTSPPSPPPATTPTPGRPTPGASPTPGVPVPPGPPTP